MDYIVHGVTKSQTRLSDFHLTLKLKDLFVKVGIQALKSDSPGSSLGSPLTSYYLWVVCVRVKSLQSCPTLCDPMDSSPPGSSVHGDSPGKNTGVGCHTLLQGIFPA